VLGAVTPLATGQLTVNLNAAGVAVVQNWVNNPASNFGFIVQQYTTALDGMSVNSRETTTPSLRPRLNVTFVLSAPPAPPPGGSSSSLAAGAAFSGGGGSAAALMAPPADEAVVVHSSAAAPSASSGDSVAMSINSTTDDDAPLHDAVFADYPETLDDPALDLAASL
jgi:hypothetical protein